MAASFPKATFFMGVLITTYACAQPTPEAEKKQNDVRTHLTDEVSSSLVNLENVIDACDTHSRSRGGIQLSENVNDSSEVTSEHWITGISHLYFNNLFECERPARERLAFSLGTLRSLSSPEEEFPADIEAINAGLLYPTKQQVEYAIQYKALPRSVRQKLEQHIGEEPFGLMDTLKENDLLQSR